MSYLPRFAVRRAVSIGTVIALFAIIPTTAEAQSARQTPSTPERAASEEDEERPGAERRKAGQAQVTIDLKPTALMQGHDLRATIKVTPDSNNRLLAVMIDAPTFYASTERELMGASAPRIYTFKWDKLPAGTYKVEAVVTDAAGRLTRTYRDFFVHGGTLDGEMQPTTPNPGRRGRRGR